MHTVELLEEALAQAAQLGFAVRQDWLGGAGGGVCEVKGQRWIFIDLAQPPRDQLEQVLAALADLSNDSSPEASPQLQSLFRQRKAA